MTIRSQIAQANGITQGRVSQLAKQGMPVDDVAAATLWIRANVRQPRAVSNTIPVSAQGDIFAEATCRAEAARCAERFAIAVVRECSEAKDLRNASRALKDYLDISKRASEAEIAAIEAGRASRKLIAEKDILHQWDEIIVPFLNRCHQAHTIKGCEWYLTPDQAAKEMQTILVMFGKRLTPAAIFEPDEKTKHLQS